MDSQFMDAGTYAWIVLIIFFVIFSLLQIRNCIQNVRNNSTTFSDMYPNEAGPSCGQSSVYTIDVNNAVQTNFTNRAYVSTETSTKNPLSTDGLPTYEEAIGAVKSPAAVPSLPARPTIEVINEDARDGNSSGDGGTNGRHRHRRRRNHRHHTHHSHHNENSEPNSTENEPRRHRHRRGLRKHLAKIKRRNHTETE